MLYQRSDEIAIDFQIVVEKNENVFRPFLREPVVREEKIVFWRHDRFDRRKFALNPSHVVIGALVIEDYNRTGAGKFLRSLASRRQQMLQMFLPL